MYKKLIKFFVFLLLLSISLALVLKAYLRSNAGFYPLAIQSHFLYRDNWQQPEQDNLIEQKVIELLNQKFSFIGKGAQIFAFESADKNYVLKIVNQKHIALMPWEKWGIQIPLIQKTLNKKLIKQQKKVTNLLSSLKLSFEELKPQTGLVYLHMLKTNHLNKHITIVDKLGISYDLNADNLEFFIQKKGKILTDAIDEEMLNGNKEKAVLLLQKVLLFLVDCASKGIDDGDKQQYALMRNVGFTDNEPIYIDTGLLTKDEKITNAINYKNDIIQRSRGLFAWLHKNYPDLYFIYINQIENI